LQFKEATEHPELRGMGTTVTMAFHLDAQLCVVHVGDSRAYLYGGDDDELYQITHDHTHTAETVRQGTLQPEQVAIQNSKFLIVHSSHPPASAPTTRNGSAPVATAGGSAASGGSCDRSSSHAKNRRNGRRLCVT
jgi:hypothetical protein